MIRVRDVTAGYGRINVLKHVSIDVAAGELVCLVGANGAGKSTLLRCIQGLLPTSAGHIEIDGEDVSGLSTEKIVRRGLSLVPETRELFSSLTVTDNLFLGAYTHRKESDAARAREDAMQKVFSIFPALDERRNARAADLSGGQQQMLAIGRALMSRPRALMLDEPSLGLAPMLVRQIFEAISELRRSGLAILLVEQNVRAALKLATRAYVLETGSIVAEGPADALANDDRLMRAYLGKTGGRKLAVEFQQVVSINAADEP
jgi:branched-chain amino acid transport system ATP-binding protein